MSKNKKNKPLDLTPGAKVVHDQHGFGVVTRKRPAGLRKPTATAIYVVFGHETVGKFVNPEALQQAHPQQIA